MAPDEWLTGLGIPLHDARARELVEAAQWQLAVHLLAQGRDVVIEWGMWSQDERLTFTSRATDAGHLVCAHFLMPSMDIVRWRVAQRNGLRPLQDRLSPEEVAEFVGRFERPDADELAQYEAVWRDGPWPV